MVIFALIATALAASPVETVLTSLEQSPPPGMVFSCQPIGQVIDHVRQSPLTAPLLRQHLLQEPKPGGEAASYVWSLLDRGGLEAAGFDPAGAIRFSVWGGPAQVGPKADPAFNLSLPFRGTTAQVETMLQALAPSKNEAEPDFVVPEGDTWAVSIVRGKDTISLRRDADGLHIQLGIPEPESPEPDLRMLAGLPLQPGCLVYVHAPDGLKPGKSRAQRGGPRVTGLTAFIPLDEYAAQIRVMTTLGTPRALALGAEVPALGHSTLRPNAVGVVSTDLLVLTRQLVEWLPSDFPNVDKLRGLNLDPDSLPFQTPPGMQFAVFLGQPTLQNRKPGPGFAAVIPIHTKRGKPMPARKILNGVKHMLEGFEVEVTDHEAGGLGADIGGYRVRIRAAKGLLVMGSIDAVVEDTVAGRGEPWASPSLIARARDFPIAVSFQGDLRMPMVAESGLRVRDGMFELALGVTVAGEGASGVAVIGMLAAIAIPNFISMQNRATRAEVPANVAGIRSALRAHHATYDKYVAVLATPRPVSALDKQSVAWPAGTPFDTLGWRPDDKVRGTYWVEILEGGKDFKVTGAIDADGDGVPAIFTATSALQVRMQTPPTVY